MTTSFPSQRSKDLYATLKGRKDPLEVGLQTSEDIAYLNTRSGRFGQWSKRNNFEGTIIGPAIAVGLTSGPGTLFGGMLMMTEGATTGEMVFTASAVAALAGLSASMTKLGRLEKKAAKALPRDARKALFKSLTADLESINHSVVESSEKSLTFTTQRGVVVTGEDENGELVLLLNGVPMQISYEGITPEPKRFITSITGQKIPVSASAATI